MILYRMLSSMFTNRSPLEALSDSRVELKANSKADFYIDTFDDPAPTESKDGVHSQPHNGCIFSLYCMYMTHHSLTNIEQKKPQPKRLVTVATCLQKLVGVGVGAGRVLLGVGSKPFCEAMVPTAG